MRKVLIVEDEEMIRKGIMLTVDWASLSCVVVGEAENGLDGLEKIRALRPDLVITDIQMPNMTGLEMLNRMREEEIDCDVIILTAYEKFEYAREAIRLDAVDYVVKPFHDGELEEVVQRLHKRRQKGNRVVSQSEERTSVPGKQAGMSRYVTKTIEYIGEHYGDTDMSVAKAAEALSISDGYLSHTFKKETNMTFNTYLTRYRCRKAIEFLKTGKYKVYEVAELVGYRDLTYFSTTFKKVTGENPSDVMK